MYNMKKHCLLIFSLLISLSVLSRDQFEGSGNIRGKITTSDGKCAPEVTVLIKGTARGTTTDEQGVFEFRKLCAGNYILLISHHGFETIEQIVSVQESTTSHTDIRLK